MSTETVDGDANPNVDTSVDVSTTNTMRERAGESRLKLWLLLKANRLHITAVLALTVFVSFVVFVAERS